MTFSKNVLFIISVLLIGLIGCQKNNPIKLLDGEYTGQLRATMSMSGVQFGTPFSTNDSATYDIHLEIDNMEFKRMDATGNQAYSGDIEIEGDIITFIYGSCDCHCDCCVNCNCAGDMILGTYNFNVNMNTLTMREEIVRNDTLVFLNNVISIQHRVHEKYYSLTKN